MMAILMTMLFMTPMCYLIKSNMILIQFMYMYMYMYMLYMDSFNYFSKVSYFLGLDNYSYFLILLMYLISSLMVISMINYGYLSSFLFLNLSLSIFIYIIFSSLSFMYMYISFEFVLVPLMILILGWGYQPERLLAGLYLFFYTIFVSLPLLLLIMYMYMIKGSVFFDYMIFHSDFFLIHFILILVFMVKMPMFLVHFWLPKAHVQAPVSGSMILAGLMLKIGGYGLIRVMFMYEYMYLSYSYFWFSISLLGSLMISLLCLIQIDIKSMIAYSSICHMGMVVMGILTMGKWGVLGSYMLMLGHGFCSSGLFYIVNLLYNRTLSRSFFINKGLMVYLPSASLMMFVFCCFNMSCPPSINFFSELMILGSMMMFWVGSIYYFMLTSFICACFSYYLYSFTQHGLYHNLYSFSCLSLLEFLCLFMHLVPLMFLFLMMKNFF
uniref:NADH dehydrogenase subunit 4 n=1 Tax=Eupelix cuspidata TaxID=139504 RepID=UPI002E7891FB|nr:NADH dehydrogenase subunit 4 [Eupelix cuspidata]WRK21448.1 NADH dehydrogenase subunit 4 [Eupelix cuspidata]